MLRPGVQLSTRKQVFIRIKITLIFVGMVVHPASPWWRGLELLGNGQWAISNSVHSLFIDEGPAVVFFLPSKPWCCTLTFLPAKATRNVWKFSLRKRQVKIGRWCDHFVVVSLFIFVLVSYHQALFMCITSTFLKRVVLLQIPCKTYFFTSVMWRVVF